MKGGGDGNHELQDERRSVKLLAERGAVAFVVAGKLFTIAQPPPPPVGSRLGRSGTLSLALIFWRSNAACTRMVTAPLSGEMPRIPYGLRK